MKAKRQKLEEQVVNLYLAKQISETLKTAMLRVLAIKEKSSTLGIEMFLNDQNKFNEINRYMTLFAEKNKKVGDQDLELHSKDHTKQLFNSLVKKGFLKYHCQDKYSLINDLSLDVNNLSDEEFLVLDNLQECFLSKQSTK